MSFISILKQVGVVAAVIEHAAAPIITAAVPGTGIVVGQLDQLVTRVQTSIQAAEIANPAAAAGAQKSASVASDFEASFNLANSFLALEGKTLTYDKDLLTTAINTQVAAYNALAAVRTSVKVVPLPLPPPASA
jgi:hypothetical protein